ncbi:MAG: hypothetical protein EP328_04380 [Gammaproteobacteria bacterium]|nr:MAG: hypothetical protein EP328_04380 [Gammaproteobacteria bacterium]
MIRFRLIGVVYAILASVALGGCQVGGSTVSEREGYFTWVDEQGRVRYTPIAESEEKNSVQALEADEASAVVDGAAGDGEFNLENYPDAEQLEQNGYVRPGDPQPYFTWQDAEGNVRVSYYRPDVRSDADKGVTATPIEITPASVYYPGVVPVPAEPVDGYDPDALAVLGVDNRSESYFERFAESCCQGLDAEDHTEWQQGREFGVDISPEASVHTFITGESPFHLVALSSVITRPDFVMRLRSYENDGVFVPSLVFLDRNFKPLRLVTDLVPRYEPENWHRRGFLEAWVPVFPAQGERWVVIFTRDEDLAAQEVIETARGPRAIPHVRSGELGLMMFEDE